MEFAPAGGGVVSVANSINERKHSVKNQLAAPSASMLRIVPALLSLVKAALRAYADLRPLFAIGNSPPCPLQYRRRGR